MSTPTAPSNLIAARLLRMSTSAREDGDAERAEHLSLAAEISSQTGVAYTSDREADHDHAVVAIRSALDRFAAHRALPITLRTAVAEAVEDLGMGDGSHRIAAAQTLILAALDLLVAEAAANADPSADRTIDGLRHFAGGTVAPGYRDDLDAWQRRRRQADGLDP